MALDADPDEPRRATSPASSRSSSIPRGSRNKYEFDEAAGVFRLDRVLALAVHYNFDYGFITDTRAGDGDHIDALLLIDEPTFPGCRVWARPIGGLEMRDDKGEDFKVLCVAVSDPHQAHVEDLARSGRTGWSRSSTSSTPTRCSRQGDRRRRLARRRPGPQVLVDDRATWLAERADSPDRHA